MDVKPFLAEASVAQIESANYLLLNYGVWAEFFCSYLHAGRNEQASHKEIFSDNLSLIFK